MTERERERERVRERERGGGGKRQRESDTGTETATDIQTDRQRSSIGTCVPARALCEWVGVLTFKCPILPSPHRSQQQQLRLDLSLMTSRSYPSHNP